MVKLHTITHEGIISIWKQRKAFADYDKDKSADALFIYSLSDKALNQQSVHLLFTKGLQVYTISSYVADDYRKDVFSDNFSSLPQTIQTPILDFWNKLDKKD